MLRATTDGLFLYPARSMLENVDAAELSHEAERFDIPGLRLFKPRIHRDVRGDLVEVYQESTYRDSGVNESFLQDNLTHSTYGCLRGLHFQLPPAAQAKLVRVIAGEVFDVVVDL